MNRIERLAAILLLLQDRPHTSEEIAGRFEVSRRTVLRDVQALSEMGVPVIAREGPGGGYALPQDYRADPLPLTGKEAFLLLLALSAVQGLSDLPFRKEFATLQAKLRAQLPREELNSAEGLMASVGVDVPERDQRAPYLDTLLEAAREERWVRVVYQSSTRVSTQHLLPRLVYTQEGLWYCRAYADEHRQERTYRVDRVQLVEATGPDFTPQQIMEERPYSHESHPQIRARLTARGAARVEVDRQVGRALRHMPDGGAEVSLRCPPGEIDYFAGYFAALGEEVEVLEPPELREKLAGLGKLLINKYS